MEDGAACMHRNQKGQGSSPGWRRSCRRLPLSLRAIETGGCVDCEAAVVAAITNWGKDVVVRGPGLGRPGPAEEAEEGGEEEEEAALRKGDAEATLHCP